MPTGRNIDVVVCGSCVVDVLVRPVPLDEPVGAGRLIRTDPITIATGGLVSNAGIAMARLGLSVTAFTYLGDDRWADLIRAAYADESIDTSRLMTLPGEVTSTTAVLIDAEGHRSFAHCVGAPKKLNAPAFRSNMDLFAASRMCLLGYYSLMPNLEADLAAVLAEIRAAGCATALDAAGDGGSMNPLADVLPQLDVYCPSYDEAAHQTGETDPRVILDRYRSCGAPGLLGVKLGADGAMLSPVAGEYIEIAPVDPPGDVVDTTGAGDCFFGGLLTGLLRGMDASDAGRLAAACGAACVTKIGASTGAPRYNDALALAGIPG